MSVSREWVSVQGGLCLEGVLPGEGLGLSGVSLSEGSLSREGVSVWKVSLSVGVSVQEGDPLSPVNRMADRRL